MALKRLRRLITKAAAKHVAPADTSKPVTNTSGRHAAAHSRRLLRRLIPVVTVIAVVLAGAAVVTVHDANANASVRDAAVTIGAPVTPLPTASPSPALAAIGTGVVDPAVQPYVAPKLLTEVPVGPQPVAKPVNTVLQSQAVITALDSNGIPAVAVQAYQHAAGVLSVTEPACHLPWQLLAGIGRVESDHGQFGGAQLLANGYGTKPIYGIPLDGRPGVALIRDTDHGKLDGDPNFDRAVGPMQFIPSTWAVDGIDGNGDGKADPNNIFDASLAAANYLCKGGRDMTNLTQEEAAVRSYNDADSYVRVVIATAESYEHGDAVTIPFTPPTTSGTSSELGLSSGSQIDPSQPRAATNPVSPATSAPRPAATPTKPATKPTTKPVTKPAQPSSPTQSSTPTAPAPKPTTIQKPTQKPTSAPGPISRPTAPSKPRPTHGTPTSPRPRPRPTFPAKPAPAPSSSPSQGHIAPPTHPVHIGHVVNVGWAPAMRQVVVVILTTPKPGSSPSAHRPNTPVPSGTATTAPARPEENRPTGRPTAQPSANR